jgi:pyruvate dehydrogenase E1 component beta subunit
MREITVRAALAEAIEEEMKRDPSVFLMGEEVAEYQGAYKISQGLLEKFGPQRVIDTPITEHAFTGLGVGAAMAGLRPIVEFMSFNFSMQAIDQIINSAAKTYYMSGGTIKSPIVFRGPNGAAAGVAAQHSQCFASWYSHCPGLRVVAPYDALSAKALLKAAIRCDDPVVFLENELLYGRSFPVDDQIETFSLDQMRVFSEGSDVTLISFSMMMDYALQAAEIMQKDHNVSVEVLDACVLRPFDSATLLKSLHKTHRIVVVEEGWPYAGIGSEVIAQIADQGFDELDAPPIRLCGKDTPLPYAPNLERLALPSVSEIVDALRTVCYL